MSGKLLQVKGGGRPDSWISLNEECQVWGVDFGAEHLGAFSKVPPPPQPKQEHNTRGAEVDRIPVLHADGLEGQTWLRLSSKTFPNVPGNWNAPPDMRYRQPTHNEKNSLKCFNTPVIEEESKP